MSNQAKMFAQVFNKLHKISRVEIHENKQADVTVTYYRTARKILKKL